MAKICLYFQVHQPYRLRPYTVFDAGPDYFDTAGNREIVRKVAEICYLPANRIVRSLLRRYAGRFKVAYSITGTAAEQFLAWAPEVIESFKELGRTGAVEFLAETYYHSLASLYSAGEFRAQVAAHGALMRRLFGVRPRVFRNTELIYSDAIGRMVRGMGFGTMLAEGWEDVLRGRGAGWVYRGRLKGVDGPRNAAVSAARAGQRPALRPPLHAA